MATLNQELSELLFENGADLVGFADLSRAGCEMPYGVSVAVACDPAVLKSIHNGPNLEYHNEYKRVNNVLDRLATAGANFLRGKGFSAIAQTRDSVEISETYETATPHKTVAVLGGLGWIGKCNLLVTKEYGSGVRISAILTDAVLDCAEPVAKSYCGKCGECVARCPAAAVTGELWSPGAVRESLYDPYKCIEKAKELSEENFGERVTICGKCIEVCPYTRRYINRTDKADTAYPNELKRYLDADGRLIEYPSKYKRQIIALFYLASKFETGRRYSEKELNDILRGWHTFDDWAMLRRDLYDHHFLNREPDGSLYWLEDEQPVMSDFGF